MMMSKEIWKPIKGFEGRYEVSSFGNVRSYVKWGCKGDLLTKPRLKVLTIHKGTGYKEVNLRDSNGNKKVLQVHKLVLEAFIGECPPGCNASHIDETKTNNHIENLKWASYKENMNMPKRLQRFIKGRPLSKTGFRGVVKIDDRYRAQITINKDRYYLGTFNTVIEAHEAYKKAYKEWYGQDYR